VTVATLCIIAAIFATRLSTQQIYKSCNSPEACADAASKINENGLFGIGPEGWTAIFTGVLTMATIFLAIVAIVQIQYLRRAEQTATAAANAAKQSADVMLRAESATLIPKGATFKGHSPRSHIKSVMLETNNTISVEFVNIGRTQCFPTRHMSCIYVGDEIPGKHTYIISSSGGGEVITPGGIYEISCFESSVYFFDEDTINEFINNKKIMWIYGFVDYTNFMDETATIKFCFELLYFQDVWFFVRERKIPEMVEDSRVAAMKRKIY
jgi:hypothetical protein